MDSTAKLSQMTDEELTVWVRTKNQEDYRELVNRYQDKAMRYAQTIMHDHDRAADVVQEAFIKAYINLRSFNQKKKFSSWFFRIIHNQAINYLKKHRKEISFGNDDWSVNIASFEEPLEVTLQKQENKQAITACLVRLPLMYRSPLALYFFEDKSYEEIGDILKLPIGTVSTRINRAKKIVRNYFNEYQQHQARVTKDA